MTAANGGSAVLAYGQTVSFTKEVTVAVGNVGDQFTDTVSVTGQDDEGDVVSDSAGTSVAYTDVQPALAVTTAAGVSTVLAGTAGQVVTYRFTVQNTSTASTDPVTVTARRHAGRRSVARSWWPTAAAVLAYGQTVSFTKDVTVAVGNVGDHFTDTLSVAGHDDEGDAASASASTSVAYTNVRTVTWDGGGADNNWTTAANWVGDAAPSPGDNLVFPAGAARMENVNDFPVGTQFGSILVAGGNYSILNNPVQSTTVAVQGDADVTVSSIVCDSLSIGGIIETDLYWDSAAVPPGSTALWDTSHAYWHAGSPTGPLQAWINDSNAFFGDCGGPSGTVFISDSSAPVFAQTIHFDDDGYSLVGFTSSDVLGLAPEGTTIEVGTGSVTIGCTVTDTATNGSLVKTGAGTLTLSGTNTYTGGTAIDDGILQIGDGGTSGNLSAHAVDSIMADGSLVFNHSDDISFDYPISGSGSLIKKGAGTLALGAATIGFAGAFTVDEGELRVSSDIDLNDVTVNGGKLICTGTVSGDILLNDGSLSPGVTADGTLTAENLDMESGATIKINFNDAGGGQVNVLGNVTLNGAVLDLESSRTDNYGVLRVLIQNNGGNAVDGTFAGLAEGDETTLGDQTYFITYHYNAETGEFGMGNDVALVSSLFGVAAVAADPYIVPAHNETETILDATRTTSTTAIVSDRYQLSCHLSQFDPAWAAGGASIAFASLDSSVASVDTSGLVTFQQTGTCGIIATATETGYADQTFEIRLTGNSSGGATNTSFDPQTIDSSNISQYVLVIYNADSPDSTAMMNYYKTNRPGVANATYLGLTAGDENTEGTIAWLYNQSNPGYHLTAIPDSRSADQAVCQAIAQYVINWLQAARIRALDPLPIRYVVGMYSLPFSDGSSHYGDSIYGFPSVAAMIEAMKTNVSSTDLPYGYTNGEDRFSIAEYGGPLVAWMDMGSYAATVAYIDKETAAANAGGLQADGVTISGTDAGVSGSKYILDDSISFQFPGLLR